MKLIKRKVEESRKIEDDVIETNTRTKINTDNLIPTGTTLLNCACADTHIAGFSKGKLVNIIGDSHSGKTLLALTCLAEVCQLKRFDDYKLIYDDAEAALEFDLEHLFGEKATKRIETDIISDTVESFYANILDVLTKERPFIYVLDTLDALTPEAAVRRGEVHATIARKRRKGEKLTKKEQEMKGGYKTEKARIMSELLSNICVKIKKVESLVIIISQTKDDISKSFTQKTRSGGKALKSFSTHEMWLAVFGTITRKGKIVGKDVGTKISKNKITGKSRTISFPVYDDYGIDDVRANVEFLVEEGVWKLVKQTIDAEHFQIKGTIDTIIKGIEEKRGQEKLRELVGETWLKVENDLIDQDRKRRYSHE